MRRLSILGSLLASLAMAGCASSGPSDADQQKMAKEFSSENVAKELEKQGKTEEAAELRAGSSDQQQ